MTLRFHWFLPTASDGRSLLSGTHRTHGRDADSMDVAGADRYREPDIEYLAQIARSAEQMGFEAILTPTGTWCEDAWLVTAALTRETERLKFLVAFRPGFVSPTLAAQMAATYQRLSRGRLVLNVVTGGESDEQARFGDHLSKDERYARAGEFLAIMRGAWTGEPFDYTGSYYDVRGATVSRPPSPVPELYFGGSSSAAGVVAAEHVDTYLTWGEPPGQVAAKLDWIRELAEERGRKLRFGIRFHVVTRDTSEAAWAEAERLIAGLETEKVASVQQILMASESTGQARMRSLHEGFRGSGDQRDLEIYPNVWAGVGLLRGGAGTALVGSHREVADRIAEYAELGIDEFILSGFPHLEETYWVGEGVLPELRRRGLAAEVGH
ncbi:LLM class flavin-dependent oxidoreductase [Lentzea californiensis]|uniref:LLM class flavin-dependent oxidoreductase n=1 Tax=Lentzea californiensis TaxID=438851 RepID=UPI0021669680|nr:LLM class flavin-dependent oxidoreductase [Lentzea californiensis]MCR3752090.1 alkanesulfonate monooxygenase [Lentzea californiensis]